MLPVEGVPKGGAKAGFGVYGGSRRRRGWWRRRGCRGLRTGRRGTRRGRICGRRFARRRAPPQRYRLGGCPVEVAGVVLQRVDATEQITVERRSAATIAVDVGPSATGLPTQ